MALPRCPFQLPDPLTDPAFQVCPFPPDPWLPGIRIPEVSLFDGQLITDSPYRYDALGAFGIAVQFSP